MNEAKTVFKYNLFSIFLGFRIWLFHVFSGLLVRFFRVSSLQSRLASYQTNDRLPMHNPVQSVRCNEVTIVEFVRTLCTVDGSYGYNCLSASYGKKLNDKLFKNPFFSMNKLTLQT